MTKRDMQYIFVGVLIICAGLAYEEDYYSVGAIVTALVAASGELRDAYERSES